MAEAKAAREQGAMSRKPFHREMHHYSWYLHQPRYRAYMLREATAIIVAIYCWLVLSALLALASDGPGQWDSFLAGQQHPGWLAWHIFSLLYLTAFQTIPWFRLAPRAMPVHLGEWKVPPVAILGLHYAGWLLCTLVLLWLLGVF